MSSRRLSLLFLAAGLAPAAACGTPAVEQVETSATVTVTVEAARAESISGVLTVTGSVTPMPGSELTIVAPEAARIAELPKAEGDVVREGDLLVKFDIPSRAAELAARRSDVAQATARLNTAKANVTRLEGLVTRGVASQRELEEARRDEAEASAALAQADSAVTAMEALESRLTVRAPFTGAVARRWHNPGDLVDASASDPILRVIDPDRVQVVAAVPLADLASLAVGRPARVIGPGGNSLAAKIVALPAEVEADRTTANVRLTFAATTRLPINTPVTIEITTETHGTAIVVPAAAIIRNEDGTFVMVAGADDKAHRQEVTLGLASRDLVEVTGIKAGDRVIVRGQEGLPDGAAITIAK
jgi:RND family efflux transporter MFP subunit